MNTKSLNKYVIKADTEKNEWTFTGEIWEGIETLLKAEREKIKKDLLKIADKGELEQLRSEVINYFK